MGAGGWLAARTNAHATNRWKGEAPGGGMEARTGKRGGEGICKLAWLVHSTTAAGGRCGVGWRSPRL